jgi:di/tricarboxylate transporter
LPIDAFLMAVAVGSASPYLTPIGHQSNTLVMAPGGYRFSDYARVGAMLDVLIVLTAVPMIMWVWLP